MVYVVRDDILLGTIELTEDSRESAKAAVLELRYQRRRVVLLTSEAIGVAKSLAADLGIEEYFAEVLPHQKASVIERLQKDGSIVTVVADPTDEAMALTQADIAVAFNVTGAAADDESEPSVVGDLALAGTDLVALSKLLKLSSTDIRIQRGNILVAFLYNLAVLGLCATSLVGGGFMVSPVIALLLMSLATVLVAVNTQRLRRR